MQAPVFLAGHDAVDIFRRRVGTRRVSLQFSREAAENWGQKLRCHGLGSMGDLARMDAGCIVGVAVAKFIPDFSDPLRPKSADERCWMHFWRGVGDVEFLCFEIVEAVPFTQRTAWLQSQLASGRRRDVATACPALLAEQLGNARCTTPVGQKTCAEVLAAWRREGRIEIARVRRIFRLPFGLASCSAHMVVRSLVFPRKECGAAFADCVPTGVLSLPANPVGAVNLPDLLEQMAALGSTIRSWAPRVAGCFGPDEADMEIEMARQQVSMLDHLLSFFDSSADLEAVGKGGARLLIRHGDGRGYRYLSVSLLQALMNSRMLSRTSHLREAVAKCLLTLFPCQRSLETLLAQRFIPSPSTLSRGQLVIDAAFMLHMRARFAQLLEDGASFFIKTDSSPLGGHDYLITEVSFSAKKDLLRAWEAAGTLVSQRQQWLDGWSSQQQQECHRQEVLFLHVLLKAHTLPPTTLGSGCADLSHKLHAFIHSLLLELGVDDGFKNLQGP